MKPQAGLGESAAAAQRDHGGPQCDRGSQGSQQADVKESSDSEEEKVARRRKTPDSELGEQQAPSSATAEDSGTRRPAKEQAAEGHPPTQGRVETLGPPSPPPEGIVRAHAAYTEQHLATWVEGLHLGAPRGASEARLVAPPPHPVPLGFATQAQAPSQTPVASAPQRQPLPQTASIFPPARAPASQVAEAVASHPGWQVACQLLQSVPPGSWPDPALLVSYLRQQGLAAPQRTSSGQFRHRVVPVTRESTRR